MSPADLDHLNVALDAMQPALRRINRVVGQTAAIIAIALLAVMLGRVVLSSSPGDASTARVASCGRSLPLAPAVEAGRGTPIHHDEGGL